MKKFICPYCNIEKTTSQNLRLHIKSHHGIEKLNEFLLKKGGIKCPCCDEILNNNPKSIFAHINKKHHNFSFLKQLSLYCHLTKLKLPFFHEETLKYLVKNNIVKTIADYSGKLYEQLQIFQNKLSQFREYKFEDIDIYFNYVKPTRERIGNVNNSRELAIAYCAGNKEEGEKFYQKIMLSKNPWYQHDGTISPFSKDFKSYQGLTEEEKEAKIKESTWNRSRSDWKDNLDGKNPTQLKYWLNQGLSYFEAKEQLWLRQNTVSKPALIKKYGEAEVTKRWEQRNEKWTKAIYDNPINVEKVKAGQQKGWLNTDNTYSRISQELFDFILDEYPELEKKYHVYYASHGGEYEFEQSNNPTHNLRPDFYIQELKLVFEFDGTTWHKSIDNKQAEIDKQRDKLLLEKYIPGGRIIRIPQEIYKKNPFKVVRRCVEMIKKQESIIQNKNK